jgi:hypothetical protein
MQRRGCGDRGVRDGRLNANQNAWYMGVSGAGVCPFLKIEE